MTKAISHWTYSGYRTFHGENEPDKTTDLININMCFSKIACLMSLEEDACVSSVLCYNNPVCPVGCDSIQNNRVALPINPIRCIEATYIAV